MEEINRNVVLVLSQYSVVVRGFERKLREMEYSVEVLAEDYDRIKGMAEWAGVLVFYLPGDIMDSASKRAHLEKMLGVVEEKGRNAILIGEAKYHKELAEAVPRVSEYMWFDRPVDMNKFADAVEKSLTAPALLRGKKRVLIVDDDPAYASMVREWIKDKYQADIVTAGMQAITFLLKKPVDLILLDYEMPVADGPKVLEMLRQENETKDIPVIFLTGNGTKEAVSRVMSLKPNGYILKSTSRENLLHLLKEKLH